MLSTWCRRCVLRVARHKASVGSTPASHLERSLHTASVPQSESDGERGGIPAAGSLSNVPEALRVEGKSGKAEKKVLNTYAGRIASCGYLSHCRRQGNVQDQRTEEADGLEGALQLVPGCQKHAQETRIPCGTDQLGKDVQRHSALPVVGQSHLLRATSDACSRDLSKSERAGSGSSRSCAKQSYKKIRTFFGRATRESHATCLQARSSCSPAETKRFPPAT